MKIIKAIINSINGIKFTIKNERAFKQEIIGAIPIIAILFYMNIGVLERLFILFLMIVILALELVNTAIERIINEQNKICDNFKIAKDCASAAVFLCIIFLFVSLLFLAYNGSID